MTKSNAKKGGVLLAAGALLLISELFPPWQYDYQYTPTFRHICPAGYGFITRAPRVRSYDQMLAICATSEVPLEQIETHKDRWRSNYQRIVLCMIIVGLLLAFAPRLHWIMWSMGIVLVLLGVVGVVVNFLIVPLYYL
jgi:hypothetical protein